jgi:dUTP pyrophosphatase
MSCHAFFKEELMSIKVKRLRDNAKVPTKAYKGDAGWDIYCCEDVRMAGIGEMIKYLWGSLAWLDQSEIISKNKEFWHMVENCKQKIGTGIAMQMPIGKVGLIWDRSGLGSRGVTVLGGVVDSGYRGEVMVTLINLGMETVILPAGSKIAQMLIQDVCGEEMIEVEELEESERGSHGFGSSGI